MTAYAVSRYVAQSVTPGGRMRPITTTSRAPAAATGETTTAVIRSS